MKQIIVIISLILVAINANAQDCQESQVVTFTNPLNQCNSNPWVLVFEDNFNGNSLDLSKWEYAGDRLRYCNREQQYYTKGDNIQVSDGMLKIIAKKDTIYDKVVEWMPENEILTCNDASKGQNLRTFYYTSADIETIRKFSNGKFEARVKIPKGKGLWPAFWTYGCDPVANEIDIFEFMNENNNEFIFFHPYNPDKLSKVHEMTLHQDYDRDGHMSSCNTSYLGDDFSQDFHTFSLIWDQDRIEWYVDGYAAINMKRRDCKYYTISGQETECTLYASTQYVKKLIYPDGPMNIILNLAILGGLDVNGNPITDAYGNVLAPDTSTIFPSQMEVDWVRYYKRVANPCQDVTITDASQLPLDNSLFNVIIGRNIVFNCTYYVSNGHQLDIVAANDITLGPGFCTEPGADVNIKIDPTICN